MFSVFDNILNYIQTKIDKIDAQSQNVIKNIVAAFGIQGLSMVVSLFTMPAYFNFFNDQVILGCWFTILSILNCILSFDLGIGNGLRNKLTYLISIKNWKQGKKVISSAYIFLFLISTVIVGFIWLLFPLIDWNELLKIDINLISKDVLLLSMEIVVTGVMLQFIFKLITSVLYALQKSALVNFMSLITNTSLMLFLIFFPKHSADNNLLILSITHVFLINLPLIIITIYIFSKQLKQCAPNLFCFNFKTAIDIFKLGFVFFILQLSFIFIASLNEFIITRCAGPEFVPEYQIYYKLFNTISSICLLALTPVWSSITKAKAENNYIWIKKTYYILCIMTFLFSIVQFLIFPFLQFAVNIWIGPNAIHISYIIALFFALSNVTIVWNNVNSVIANGLEYLIPQFLFLTVAAMLKIPVSIMFYYIIKEWYAIVLATTVVMLPVNICQPIMLKKFIDQKINKKDISYD